MSDNDFHVHGPHDHALEDASHSRPDSFSGQLAVITALLATLGAIFSHMGGVTQFNSGTYKNDAAIKKTEAANQWAYYQAKSNKQNMSELGIDLAPDAKKAFYQDEVIRYATENEEIKARAERLEAESIAFEEKSAHQSHLHHRWAQATTLLQVSIAMAAIALLTQRKWLVYGVLGLGAIGSALGAMAWMSV